MGMFDYIDFEAVCPVCHAKVEGFQSKDSHCTLAHLPPIDVNHFYTPCKKCGCWITYTKCQEGHCKDNAYERKVRGKEDKLMPEHDKIVLIPLHPDAPDDYLNPNWDEAQKVHEWKNYISEDVVKIWDTFTPSQKAVLAAQAQNNADNEEWE